MYYTSFSLEMPTEDAATNIAATVAHMFAGCTCPPECSCNDADGCCEACRFDTTTADFQCTIAQSPHYYIHSVYTRPGEMLHVSIYSETQFTYEGLRTLVDTLRGYAKEGHITMNHLHKDFLTGEQATGKVSDHAA